MNIIENNKLIAEFMGGKEIRKDTYKFPNRTGLPLQIGTITYHSDWNWLMEVVEKIESLGSNKILNRVLYSRFEIKHNKVLLYWSKDNNYQIQIETLQDWQDGYKSTSYKNYRRVAINKNTTKLESIYLVCVEFIKWYNEQK